MSDRSLVRLYSKNGCYVYGNPAMWTVTYRPIDPKERKAFGVLPCMRFCNKNGYPIAAVSLDICHCGHYGQETPLNKLNEVPDHFCLTNCQQGRERDFFLKEKREYGGCGGFMDRDLIDLAELSENSTAVFKQSLEMSMNDTAVKVQSLYLVYIHRIKHTN